jgi:lipopolysaccharide export system protein LptA
MIRHIRKASSVGAVLIVAAGWAAAAQTGGHAAPAPQATQGVPNPLQGFSQNSDQPIKIESVSLEVRDKDHIATFIGNVHVVQGDTTMKCKTLVVFYDEKPATGAAPNATAAAPKKGQSGSGNQQIKRLEAKGGVVITQSDQTATGDSGVFDMKTNTATLIGNVVVTQGQNVVHGDRLVMDMTTGVARVESDKSNKGQVKALFLPNSPPAGPSGNAPAAGGAKETKPSAPMKIN